MFGGVPPWGLAAEAPPLPVVIGPAEPGDWDGPLLSSDDAAPPLMGCEALNRSRLGSVWAYAVEVQAQMQSAASTRRM
jgi:hypothetical protein